MEKFKRVWKIEGESLESYSKRLKEVWEEMNKAHAFDEIIINIRKDIKAHQ